MSRSNLLLLKPSSANKERSEGNAEGDGASTDNACSSDNLNVTGSEGSSMNSSKNRSTLHTQHSKIKFSMLNLLRQMCDITELRSVLQGQVNAFVYLVLNLLSGNEVIDILLSILCD